MFYNDGNKFLIYVLNHSITSKTAANHRGKRGLSRLKKEKLKRQFWTLKATIFPLRATWVHELLFMTIFLFHVNLKLLHLWPLICQIKLVQMFSCTRANLNYDIKTSRKISRVYVLRYDWANRFFLKLQLFRSIDASITSNPYDFIIAS